MHYSFHIHIHSTVICRFIQVYFSMLYIDWVAINSCLNWNLCFSFSCGLVYSPLVLRHWTVCLFCSWSQHKMYNILENDAEINGSAACLADHSYTVLTSWERIELIQNYMTFINKSHGEKLLLSVCISLFFSLQYGKTRACSVWNLIRWISLTLNVPSRSLRFSDRVKWDAFAINLCA